MPFSGSVAQRIEPNTNWFFDSIAADAGNGDIEKKAFDVASYGRQLGLLTDVLIALADREGALSVEAAKSLGRLKDIQSQIQKIKEDEASSVARNIESQVRGLRTSNPAEFERLRASLSAILGEESV